MQKAAAAAPDSPCLLSGWLACTSYPELAKPASHHDDDEGYATVGLQIWRS
jgi:hypothetical protein